MVDLTWTPRDGSKGGRDENALIEIGHEGNHEDMNAALEGHERSTRRRRSTSPGDPTPLPPSPARPSATPMTLKGIKKKVVPGGGRRVRQGPRGVRQPRRAQGQDPGAAARQASEERRVERDVRSALVEALVAKVSFEVPEALVEHHMTARTENLARGLAYQGLDPRKVDINWREYRESQRDNSVKAARADILLDEIATREDVEVLDAESTPRSPAWPRATGKVSGRGHCAFRCRKMEISWALGGPHQAKRRSLTCSRPMLVSS